MLARVKRILQGASSGPPPAQKIKSQSPMRPRLSGPRFSEPPSPEPRSRSGSPARSRSPVAGKPLCGRTSIGHKRRSSLARRRLSFSPPAGRRRTSARLSFPHRDFANPEAETCWLSCLFQALWHSVVFHSTFEAHLVPEIYNASEEEVLLTALQRTWAEYKAEKSNIEQDVEKESEAIVDSLVPADCLVDGFGEGYGDMSEALACLQAELCESANAAAIGLSERMVLLPMTPIEDLFPTPAAAWKQALEWQVTGASLIAVDLSIPALSQDGVSELASLWVPQAAETLPSLSPGTAEAAKDQAQENSQILDGACAQHERLGAPGNSHRLVALVCYMWNLQHYVAFCRRQSDSSSCMFFNDLPELTQGVPKEVSWARVPELCKNFSLQPRLLLYEAADVSC